MEEQKQEHEELKEEKEEETVAVMFILNQVGRSHNVALLDIVPISAG